MHIDNLWLIVKVPNGNGVMPARFYENQLPEPVKATVEILAVCPSEDRARWIYGHLPQDWRDVGLAWYPDSETATVVK
jgi:glucose dehydrogenase